MRLLTWNVCFDERRFRDRTIALLRAIAAGNYDVVALQEVTDPLRTALGDFAARMGYALHGADSGFGYDVALLARDRAARFAQLALPTAMGRRAIALTLPAHDDLAIATVHLESMASGAAMRVAQLARLGPWLAARSPDTVLVGDLNFDEYDARESDVLDEAYVDVWPALHPKSPGPTCGKRRFDHVFLRSRFFRATAIELVGDTTISDHLGVGVELTP